MAMNYDVIIVGAGPAGIFASLELCDAGLDVLLLDKGKEIEVEVVPSVLPAIWLAALAAQELSVMGN